MQNKNSTRVTHTCNEAYTYICSGPIEIIGWYLVGARETVRSSNRPTDSSTLPLEKIQSIIFTVELFFSLLCDGVILWSGSWWCFNVRVTASRNLTWVKAKIRFTIHRCRYACSRWVEETGDGKEICKING